MSLRIGSGMIRIGIGRPSISWSSWWKAQSNFYELWKVTGAGTMIGLKRGDELTITGSGLNAIYAVPDTAAYKTIDTDYVFHKSNGDISTACDGNRLIAYDFPRVIVKYLDVSPYTIEYIGILDTGKSVTNKMRDDFHLSIWWDNTLSAYGYTKQNKPIAGQYVWTPESGYCAEAVAYFARMAVQPNDATKILIDAFFVGIKSDGVYTELDTFALYFLHTEQASLLDIKSDTFNHTTVNTPIWTAKTGYEIIATSYIRSHFIPISNGVKYTLNDASIINGVNPLTIVDCVEGVVDVFGYASYIGYAGYMLYNCINAASNQATTWVNGFNAFIRTNATTIIIRANDIENAYTKNSVERPSKEYFIGAYNNNGVVGVSATGNKYKYYGFASKMSLSMRIALEARLATLYAAIQTAW
jgi:hypothetical protein